MRAAQWLLRKRTGDVRLRHVNIADTAGTCPSGYPHCSDPTPSTPGLDAAAKLICEQQAP